MTAREPRVSPRLRALSPLAVWEALERYAERFRPSTGSATGLVVFSKTIAESDHPSRRHKRVAARTVPAAPRVKRSARGVARALFFCTFSNTPATF